MVKETSKLTPSSKYFPLSHLLDPFLLTYVPVKTLIA